MPNPELPVQRSAPSTRAPIDAKPADDRSDRAIPTAGTTDATNPDAIPDAVDARASTEAEVTGAGANTNVDGAEAITEVGAVTANAAATAPLTPAAEASASPIPGREPARGTRLALTALWVGYLPVWLVVLAVATPSVPVVLLSFALWILLLARVHQTLRRHRCERCGERYYSSDLFGVLGGTGCTGCEH
ncbi:MAG: hypothetical protein JW751_17500 [Polyangiaceae bacterium]|nr:hypothetical protein [Polyangiaceae bacterium]